MACHADLTIYQGDDYLVEVGVYESTGAPADLTGWTAEAQLRRKPADQDAEVAVQMNVTVDPEGWVFLTIAHTVTETLGGRYVWDLQMTSPEGLRYTALAGSVAVTPEVTRAVAPLTRRPTLGEVFQ